MIGRACVALGVAFLLTLLLPACNDSSQRGLVLEEEEETELLSVRIDAQGNISFRVPSDVKTPELLGTGEPDDAFNPTSYYGVSNTLTVRINGRDLFFDLHGTLFRLEYRSLAYHTTNLIQYGKDLILMVEPGLRTSDTVTLLPINERLKTEAVWVTLEYVELDGQTVRIFFDVARAPDSTAPSVVFAPNQSCLHETQSGLLSIGEAESYEYMPSAVTLSVNEPGVHLHGYAEYPRRLLRPDYRYEFRYECADAYTFELPFKVEQ
ncbi:MAG: hypothetical protein KatS3mg051_0067 [Anaerolineae bacterium]|jgi:hypothetical protein|nr:MAG: hypothetical protein KatS3mg051_0067 [Anaerolineae bacterium]